MATTKELYGELNEKQSTIQAQAQEIERLRKQNEALQRGQELFTLPNGDLHRGVDPDRPPRPDTLVLSPLDKARSKALHDRLMAEALTGDPAASRAMEATAAASMAQGASREAIKEAAVNEALEAAGLGEVAAA